MFASKHPFRDTLIIEIDRDEILALHGQIVSNRPEISLDTFLSMLEGFNAGTDISRFEREEESHSVAVDCSFPSRQFRNHSRPSEDDTTTEEVIMFRNHGEEIDAAIRAHNLANKPLCNHSHYSDGHCAEMSCWNYHSKCLKHSASGRDSERCSIENR